MGGGHYLMLKNLHLHGWMISGGSRENEYLFLVTGEDSYSWKTNSQKAALRMDPTLIG